MTSWDLVYYLLRANYDRVDSAYLEDAKLPEERSTDGEISYKYGCTVRDLVDEGSQIRVAYKKALDDGTESEETMMADLVIAADGPSSTIRGQLEPSVERKYAGYAVIRGTVPEPEASQGALDVFRERFCFFHGPGIQNLTYTIAGKNGSTKPGERLLNFVWYTNFPEGEDELEKVMTDCDGRRRRITIPPGKISAGAWDMLKSKADGRLPAADGRDGREEQYAVCPVHHRRDLAEEPLHGRQACARRRRACRLQTTHCGFDESSCLRCDERR